MSDEEIRLGQTLEELGAQIDTAADRAERDEPYLDRNLRPITDKEMLERLRELELTTGELLIFRPHEPGPGVS
jgi:hypothetical protein